MNHARLTKVSSMICVRLDTYWVGLMNRDTDILIAINIFGLEIEYYPLTLVDGTRTIDPDYPADKFGRFTIPETASSPPELWHFSTDFGAISPILHRIHSRGFDLSIRSDNNGSKWICHILNRPSMHDPEVVIGEGNGKCIPEAICNAVLYTKELYHETRT